MSRIIASLKQAVRWARGDRSAGRSTIVRAPAKPGARETAILHAIRVLHDNAYGVTIQEELERRKMDLSFLAIGEALDWLVANGFVEGRMGSAATPGSPGATTRRRLYTLTSKGEEALRG